jgi:hypothetical protein
VSAGHGEGGPGLARQTLTSFVATLAALPIIAVLTPTIEDVRDEVAFWLVFALTMITIAATVAAWHWRCRCRVAERQLHRRASTRRPEA